MTQLQCDLTSLRAFVAVCDTRNFAHAALRLHLVGSAVSKRMAALESQLGTALFVRQRHGVAPTAAGETFLEYARAMLAEAQKAERVLSAFSSGVKGHVRLLATASVMAAFLAEDIVSFMGRPAHAEIKVDIEERLSPDVIQGVREGHASLGIVWNQANVEGLETMPYRCDHLGIVVPRHHPLAEFEQVAFEQTLAWEQVSLPAGSAMQALLERTAALSDTPWRSRAMVSNFEAGMRMVAAGLAICVVPREMFSMQSHPLLKWVGLTNAWATRQFVLCHRPRDGVSAATQMLMEHLVNQHPGRVI